MAIKILNLLEYNEIMGVWVIHNEAYREKLRPV